MSQEIARVEQLVRRMLTYARPLAPRLEPCEVSRLVSMGCDASRPACEKAKVKLLRHEEPGLPQVVVDPMLVTQALSNLLVNAAQASPPEGGVTLSASLTDVEGKRYLALRVTDEGQGISAAALPNLFQPFYTTKPRGNGLGLALSQNIAREHGGMIVAQNRQDRSGAEFALLLPIEPLPAGSPSLGSGPASG